MRKIAKRLLGFASALVVAVAMVPAMATAAMADESESAVTVTYTVGAGDEQHTAEVKNIGEYRVTDFDGNLVAVGPALLAELPYGAKAKSVQWTRQTAADRCSLLSFGKGLIDDIGQIAEENYLVNEDFSGSLNGVYKNFMYNRLSESAKSNLKTADVKGFACSYSEVSDDENGNLVTLYTAAVVIQIPTKSQSEGMTLSVGSVKANPGDEVTLPVAFENNPGLTSLSTQLTFDQDALEFVGTSAGQPLQPAGFHFAGEEVPAGELVTNLTFKVKEDAEEGDYEIAFKSISAYKGEEDLEKTVKTVSGAVKVEFTPAHVVMKQVRELPAEVTPANAEAVVAARAAYDELSADNQARVSNYVKLVEAEKAIAVAEKKAADEALAKAKADAEAAAAQAANDKQASEQAAAKAAAEKKAAEQAAAKAAADKKAADEALAKAKAELATAKATVSAQASKVKGLKAKSKKAKVKVSWKKSSGADGYQVAYKKASAKKFKTAKTSKAKFSKKLKKGKAYVVKVRTFKKIDGKVVYGQWTDLKTVKCK